MEVVYAGVLNGFATTTLVIKMSYRAEILTVNPPLPFLCAERLAARVLPTALQESWWFIQRKRNILGLSSVPGF